MLVNGGGMKHKIIQRYDQNSKLTILQLDLVEHTYEMFKIQTLKMLSPLKLYINYKKLGITIRRDLRVYYSFTNHKPEEGDCDAMI